MTPKITGKAHENRRPTSVFRHGSSRPLLQYLSIAIFNSARSPARPLARSSHTARILRGERLSLTQRLPSRCCFFPVGRFLSGRCVAARSLVVRSLSLSDCTPFVVSRGYHHLQPSHPPTHPPTHPPINPSHPSIHAAVRCRFVHEHRHGFAFSAKVLALVSLSLSLWVLVLAVSVGAQ